MRYNHANKMDGEYWIVKTKQNGRRKNMYDEMRRKELLRKITDLLKKQETELLEELWKQLRNS